SAVRDHLVAALDDWLGTKWKAGFPGAEPLLAVVQRADPDVWRNQFRHALRRGDGRALETLARDPEVIGQLPVTMYMLASSLGRNGQAPVAVEVLKQAQRRGPDDFWLNRELAYQLVGLNRPAEAVGYYRAALVRRPGNPYTIVGLGYALQRDDKPAEA